MLHVALAYLYALKLVISYPNSGREEEFCSQLYRLSSVVTCNVATASFHPSSNVASTLFIGTTAAR